jgi:probable rRNA maturation factor
MKLMTETSSRIPETAGDHAAAASGGRRAGEGTQNLDIQCGAGIRRVDVDWLRERLAGAIRMVAGPGGRPIGRLSLALVDDRRMAELHGRHLGDQNSTDVLTFCARGDDGAIEADIAVCVDEAARQATERGHSVERELLLYAIHGLLHCAGYDDHDQEGFRAMHEREDMILREIGVGATFGAPNPEGSA